MTARLEPCFFLTKAEWMAEREHLNKELESAREALRLSTSAREEDARKLREMEAQLEEKECEVRN